MRQTLWWCGQWLRTKTIIAFSLKYWSWILCYLSYPLYQGLLNVFTEIWAEVSIGFLIQCPQFCKFGKFCTMKFFLAAVNSTCNVIKETGCKRLCLQWCTGWFDNVLEGTKRNMPPYIFVCCWSYKLSASWSNRFQSTVLIAKLSRFTGSACPMATFFSFWIVKNPNNIQLLQLTRKHIFLKW